MPPTLLFGTATFGMDGTAFQSPETIYPVLRLLKDRGVKCLDTGARYPPRNPGRAETLIGETLAKHEDLQDYFTIDTKILTPSGNANGDLSKDNMRTSLAASLKRLGVEKVRCLYAHVADFQTSLEEQVEAFNEHVDQGHCEDWGVSNHPVEHLREMLEVCESLGVRGPSVYQGDYNVVTRGMEGELLGLLREKGMRFVGFRPIAAGFLTGALATGDIVGTRFDPATNPIGAALTGVFGARELKEAFLKFKAVVEKAGLSTVEVAWRWLMWHSALKEGDGVILGASKMEQVVMNLDFIEKGRLDEHEDVLEACDEVWRALEKSRGGVL